MPTIIGIRRAYDWWADRYCPKSIWRWHVRPLGRRGGLLALLWLGVAAQVAVGTRRPNATPSAAPPAP